MGYRFQPDRVRWVADGGTGKSTLYDGAGRKNTNLVVTVGAPAGEERAEVTGIVFNSAGFQVTSAGKTGVSAFIFATEQGTLSGWSPQIDFTHTIQVVDNSKANAVYKGLAPADFGKFSGTLLVGNFGEGTIPCLTCRGVGAQFRKAVS